MPACWRAQLHIRVVTFTILNCAAHPPALRIPALPEKNFRATDLIISRHLFEGHTGLHYRLMHQSEWTRGAGVDWRIAASFAESTGSRAVPGQLASGPKAQPCGSVQASGEDGELLPYSLLTSACLLGSHLQVSRTGLYYLTDRNLKVPLQIFCQWT